MILSKNSLTASSPLPRWTSSVSDQLQPPIDTAVLAVGKPKGGLGSPAKLFKGDLTMIPKR